MRNENNDLTPHWLITGFMFLTLAAYVVISHVFGPELRQPLAEDQRVLIRTVFYGLAIAGLPITNLIRHIQLRLNQTMPGPKPAKSRYLLTVIVSAVLVESIGLMGFLMYILGDGFNTLYIFTGLAALGLLLYRPKPEEYESIVEALKSSP